MHSDVASLVEAGRISPEIGERLNQVAPDSYLLHRTWGAGKVVSWDLSKGKIFLDFVDKQNQEMGLQFVISKTEPLEQDDFRAQKLEKLDELQTLAKDDVVELMKRLLKSNEGSMTLDQVDKNLSGSVIPGDKTAYKKWWEVAKKKLRESKVIIVPSKRNDPIILRKEDITPLEALLSDYNEAGDTKTRVKAVEAIQKDLALFEEEPEKVQFILDNLDETARMLVKIKPEQALDLLACRDDLTTAGKIELSDNALRISDVLVSEEAQVVNQLSGLNSSRLRRICDAFPAAFGEENWVKEILGIFNEAGSRAVSEIAKKLINEDFMDELVDHLRISISKRNLGVDPVIWICRERKRAAERVFTIEVGATALAIMERDALEDGPRTTGRLASLLNDDKELIPDLIAAGDKNEIRNFCNRLLSCPAFTDLERKSLMARVIKIKPEMGDMVTSSQKQDNTIISSFASIDRRRDELKEIINEKIPQNIKDISIARSYGDLRENFEYKAAKQMQSVLANRRAQIEMELDNVQGSDFKGADTSSVNIGTIVELETAKKEKFTYTVLGAWDSEPERNEVSYLSEVGKTLMGMKVGDKSEVIDLIKDKKFMMTVTGITAVNP